MLRTYFLFLSALLAAFELKAQIFAAHPSNPVITTTQPKPGMWNDPSVIKKDNEYWMYLTSTSGAEGTWGGNVLCYLMTSADGIAWTLSSKTPLFQTSTDSSAWDKAGTETPDVVYFKGKYHLYYTAVPGNGQMALGHAVSEDGLTWTKDRIILTPSNNMDDWMSYQVAEPGAVVFNDKIFLYFTGTGIRPRNEGAGPGGKAVIGLITSDDGFNFSNPQVALEQGPLYPAANEFYGYSTADAVVAENKIHLFYDVASEKNGEWKQVAIHHAYSADGRTGFTEDSAPVFVKEDFDWTAREIRSPVVLVEDGKFRMWFAGDDIFNSGQWGIGYAERAVVSGLNPVAQDHGKLNIFPNPAENFIQFHHDADMQVEVVSLKDLSGTTIISAAYNGINELRVDRTKIQPGYYILEIETPDSGKVTAPIILK